MSQSTILHNQQRTLFIGLVVIIAPSQTRAQSDGRLWVPGPNVGGSGSYVNEIHELCVPTKQRRTIGTFTGQPGDFALCPDGGLYVTVQPDQLVKLNPTTGEVISSCTLTAWTTGLFYLGCNANGNLLLAGQGVGSGRLIHQLKPDCTDLGVWATASTDTVRYITTSPTGTVVLMDGGAGGANNLEEYDVSGNHLRTLISASIKMD